MFDRPSNYEETTRALWEAGVADRVLEVVNHHFPRNGAHCNFWVEVKQDGPNEYALVCIRYGVRVAGFRAASGRPFGRPDAPPLDEDQMELVWRLAEDHSAATS